MESVNRSVSQSVRPEKTDCKGMPQLQPMSPFQNIILYAVQLNTMTIALFEVFTVLVMQPSGI